MAVLAAGPFAWSVAVGYALGAAFVFIIQARWLDPSGSLRRFSPGAQDVFDQLKRYGRPFIGFGVTAVAVAYSDVWSVRLFGGDVAAGVYAVAALLASVMAVIEAMLVQYLFPVAFEQAGFANDPGALSKAFRTSRRGALLMASVTLLAVVGAAVGGDSLVVALSSSDFRSAGSYLPVLVLGIGLLQTGEVLALTALSATQLGGLSVVKIHLAVVSVGANLIGAATLRAPGVALASVVTGLTYFMLVVAISVRLTRVARSRGSGR
jgi:O-antigen/teichoic acid export membrane protein